mgnify:CR=1 FL=1
MADNTEMRREAQLRAERVEAYIRVSLRRWIRENVKTERKSLTNAVIRMSEQDKLCEIVKGLGGNVEEIMEKARGEIVDYMVLEMDR